MTTHTVAVTGASGFVGRAVVAELLQRGHKVRGLVRSAANARAAFGGAIPPGLSLVSGDATDGQAVGELLAGCDVCVHLVGIIRETRGESAQKPQTFERLHEQATQTVLSACAAGGVRRFVHMSALGVGPEGRAPYQKTKWNAEVAVRRSSLDWTVFRPSLIHGPDGEFINMMADLASGEIPPYLFIPYFARAVRDTSVPAGAVSFEPAKVQPVAVEDVAYCFAEAISRPQTVGEVYNLAGPEVLNWQELSEFLRDNLHGTKREMATWHIPGEHAAMIATVAGMIGLGSLLPFDAGQALMATEDSTADLYKVRADLGLEPRPFRETVRSYASKMA